MDHNGVRGQLDKAEEGGIDHMDPMEIEKMKKEELRLKDQAYARIMEHENK